MDYEALKDAMDGLYAYENGSRSSGIFDRALRVRVAEYLRSQCGDHEVMPKVVGRIVRDLFLSDEAMAEGYGPEDALSFLRWVDLELM